MESGFENAPEGQLLRQVLDFDGDLGIAYERSIGFEKATHVHQRHMLVFPRHATRMRVSCHGCEKPFSLDSRNALWVPRNLPHDDVGLSLVYDTLALFPSDAYFDSMVRDNGIDASAGEILRTMCVPFKRSSWLQATVDRYFFERIVNKTSPAGCVFFLEKQILNEVVRIIFARNYDVSPEPVSEDALENPLLARCFRYIETHLFGEISLAGLADAAKTSPSTLLRQFQATFGQSPLEFVRNRRLDEARHLLSLGKYHVGDVATLVGYADFGSFSKAYKLKFGHSPSESQAR